MITHLPKIKSDHGPLLLTTNSKVPLPKERPFRFLDGWIEHPGFSNFVKENSGFTGNMSSTLGELSRNLKDWNKSVYGHITSRKKLLIKELSKIQEL